MANEDFATYTEVDPNSHITVAGNQVSVVNGTRNEDAYVYSDKGSGHFSGEYAHFFKLRVSSASETSATANAFCLANAVDDRQGMSDVSSYIEGYIFVYPTAGYDYRFEVRIHDVGLHHSLWWFQSLLDFDTDYWVAISVDQPNGWVGAAIYSDAARTNLIKYDNASLRYVFGPDFTLETFRYIYAYQSSNTGYTNKISLDVYNLDLGFNSQVGRFKKWCYDQNNDVVEDAQIGLYDCSDDSEVDTYYSDPLGLCEFQIIEPGSYRVDVDADGIPCGYSISAEDNDCYAITAGATQTVYNYFVKLYNPCEAVVCTADEGEQLYYGVSTEYNGNSIGIAYMTSAEVIKFVRSIDDGNTWDSPVQISDLDAWDAGWIPKLTSGSTFDVLYCTWGVRNEDISDDELRISKSTDGGQSWGTSVAITRDDVHDYDDNSEASIAVDSGGRVFVAWIQWADLYVARSTDGGDTWFVTSVATSLSSSNRTDICVDNDDRLYVSANDDGDAKVWRSDDNGITWSGAKIANPTQSGYSTWLDSVRVEVGITDTVYVAWYDYDNEEVYLAYSTDMGETWSTPSLVVAGEKEYDTLDMKVCANGQIYVTYWDDDTPYYNTFGPGLH